VVGALPYWVAYCVSGSIKSPCFDRDLFLRIFGLTFSNRQGLAWQFAERISEIPNVIDQASMRETCSNWNAYATENGIITDDSGV